MTVSHVNFLFCPPKESFTVSREMRIPIIVDVLPAIAAPKLSSALATINDLHVQSFIRCCYKCDKRVQYLLATRPAWTKADIAFHQCKWPCNLRALAITNMDLSTTWPKNCARCPCSEVNFTAKLAMSTDANYENCIFGNHQMESVNTELSKVSLNGVKFYCPIPYWNFICYCLTELKFHHSHTSDRN